MARTCRGSREVGGRVCDGCSDCRRERIDADREHRAWLSICVLTDKPGELLGRLARRTSGTRWHLSTLYRVGEGQVYACATLRSLRPEDGLTLAEVECGQGAANRWRIRRGGSGPGRWGPWRKFVGALPDGARQVQERLEALGVRVLAPLPEAT